MSSCGQRLRSNYGRYGSHGREPMNGMPPATTSKMPLFEISGPFFSYSVTLRRKINTRKLILSPAYCFLSCSSSCLSSPRFPTPKMEDVWLCSLCVFGSGHGLTCWQVVNNWESIGCQFKERTPTSYIILAEDEFAKPPCILHLRLMIHASYPENDPHRCRPFVTHQRSCYDCLQCSWQSTVIAPPFTSNLEDIVPSNQILPIEAALRT
jgi:hypothetical protein